MPLLELLGIKGALILAKVLGPKLGWLAAKGIVANGLAATAASLTAMSLMAGGVVWTCEKAESVVELLEALRGRDNDKAMRLAMELSSLLSDDVGSFVETLNDCIDDEFTDSANVRKLIKQGKEIEKEVAKEIARMDESETTGSASSRVSVNGTDRKESARRRIRAQERRRLRGGRLLLKGMRQAEVARCVGVSPATVCKWNSLLKHGGLDALRQK